MRSVYVAPERPRMPKEFQRRCRRCGTVWHSLASREAKVKRDTTCSRCDEVTCSPTRRVVATRNVQAMESEYQRLRTCPKCGSSAYEEKVVR